MQLLSACWRDNEQLLRSQGIEETAVAQTWAAVTAYVRQNLTQGRGVHLPGICKLLLPKSQAPESQGTKSSASGLSVVLSDKLSKQCPNMQLGSGMSHFTAIRDQVEGAEDINHIKLAHRCPALSKDAVQSVLRAVTTTTTHLIQQQQTFSVDLGAGQLRFKSGRVVEFQPSSAFNSSNSPAKQQAAVNADGSHSSKDLQHGGITAEAAALGPAGTVSQGTPVNGSDSSSIIQPPKAAAAADSSSGPVPGLGMHSNPAPRGTAASPNSSSTGSRTLTHPDKLPDKPSSSPMSPNDTMAARRQARTAAAANARVKPATFVLPCGGPGDMQEQRVPQGKGRPAAVGSLAHQQVLEAASMRSKSTAAQQAAAEAELVAKNEALKSSLDAQAQQLRQQQAANKKHLADTLAQQIRERQSGIKPLQDTGGALLLTGTTAEQAAQLRLKQQTEYRAALDQQLAAKTSRQQQEMTKEAERAVVELQRLQQSLVAAAQASKSSKQRSMEALRQQLDQQMLHSKKADDY